MDFGFLLVFLVLLHLMPSLSGQNYNTSTCPKNFACLNLNSPQFYNKCGLCMASCDTNSRPKIKLHHWSDQWFEFQDNPRSNVIKLHDPTFQKLLNDRNCNSSIYDIYFDLKWGRISYKILTNITLFKCRKNLDSSREKDLYFQKHKYNRTDSCGDFEIYYRDPNSKVLTIPPDGPLPFGCSAVNLPMRPIDKVSNFSNLFDLLTADFDLEWHPYIDCDELCQLEVDQFKSNEIRESDVCGINNSGQGKRKLEIIIGTFVPVIGVCLLVILVFKNCGSLASKRYHYSYLKKMTNSFSIKLGQGGYGSVYKGTMEDGSLVAVKILKESKGNGEEFINEVASISRTSHVNIVTLLGFCFEGQKRALIYEFMANGSLEKFIYEEKSLLNRQLEWPTLFRIAIGIARGLEYLHNGCNTRILHFDIKPHNILLDGNFIPKISDFGLAKLCTRRESIITTIDARGTIGYIAPEVVCKNIGGVSHKSDVYSYGMMVLEMVGGRKNVDVGVDRASEIYFPHWIYSKLRHGEELGLSGIVNEEENKQARKMLIVSLWCIQTNPSSRPTINNALEMLEGPLEALGMPPKPYLYSPSRTSPERLTQSYHVSTLFGS